MTWASPVPTCWPISAFTMCIVTLPSGVIVNQIEGVKPDMAVGLGGAAAQDRQADAHEGAGGGRR